MDRLQIVQNAAARVVTRSCRSSHITPVLKALQWLPNNIRVHLKILVIAYKALHGQAPSYNKVVAMDSQCLALVPVIQI